MDDEYASEITKLAVARACVALGFKQCEKSAIESLADILQNYIRTLGLNAQEQAEISGRAHAGIQDVIPVLEFTRPKNTNWKELRSFAFEDVKNPTMDSTKKWCQPFPFDVPSFPVAADSTSGSKSALSVGDTTTTKDPYIPNHLPAFPPAHTYKRSSSKKRSSDGGAGSSEQPKKQSRSAAIKSAQSSLAIIEDSIDILASK